MQVITDKIVEEERLCEKTDCSESGVCEGSVDGPISFYVSIADAQYRVADMQMISVPSSSLKEKSWKESFTPVIDLP